MHCSKTKNKQTNKLCKLPKFGTYIITNGLGENLEGSQLWDCALPLSKPQVSHSQWHAWTVTRTSQQITPVRSGKERGGGLGSAWKGQGRGETGSLGFWDVLVPAHSHSADSVQLLCSAEKRSISSIFSCYSLQKICHHGLYC